MTSSSPTWAGSVDARALAALINLQGEQDWLDYKRQCDLSSTRGVVELAKDVGAMMIAGGYILVGADDHGEPTGDVKHLELFDPATLHNKLSKYLPQPLAIRSATHQYQGQSYALIYVEPHPDGFGIFERDGTYQEGKRQETVFRSGDVYARHGTRSERWNQHDAAVIKARLNAKADRGREQETEAAELLQKTQRQLGGRGLWLAVAVVPEYLVADAPRITPDAAQQFLSEWHLGQSPIEPIALGTATSRQPGGVVIGSQISVAELPWWWRLSFYDNGQAAGAHILAADVAKSAEEDERSRGLSSAFADGQTVLVRRDELEIRLLTLLDMLSARSSETGASGEALLMTMLVAAESGSWTHVAMVEELVDDSGQHHAWRPASPKGREPREDSLDIPVTSRVQLADLRDTRKRLKVAHRLAAELLAIFSVNEPGVLTAEGTLDPYGAATDRDQTVYRHARHLGLAVDQTSPMERRQRYEEDVRLAKQRLQQR